MLGRGIQLFLILALLLGAYIAGYYQGSGQWPGQNTAPSLSIAPLAQQNQLAQQQKQGGPANLSGDISGDTPANEYANLLANGAWFQLERWLGEHAQTMTQQQGQDLVAAMSRQFNKYDALAMRSVLRAYLDVMPEHIDAMFLLSDLQQISGMREGALETLFELLAQPLPPETFDKAKRSAEQIINVIDNELRGRGALADRAAFWQHVSARVPSSDFFRYQWARALAQYKQHDEALRILAQTGTTDVSQQSLDDLVEQILLAQTTVQFQRDGDRMLSLVETPGGLSITLLVDTGANVTSLTKSALRRLAAQRLPEQARVRTAGGIVTTSIYTVPEMLVEGRLFSDLRVIELPVELPGIDGLLGTDLINQLAADPLLLPTQ
jgi:predicted aspartyl protease/thioredoxin-like negative regulator of GroEL